MNFVAPAPSPHSQYPLLDRYAAVAAANRGIPWRVRLEMVDARTNTDKFWECYALGSGQVTLHFGRNGTEGQYQSTDRTYMYHMAEKKIAKGYRYVLGQPQVAAPVEPEPLEGPYALIRKVRPVRKGVGGVIESWEALDAKGRLLLVLTPDGARHLLQFYPGQRISVE